MRTSQAREELLQFFERRQRRQRPSGYLPPIDHDATAYGRAPTVRPAPDECPIPDEALFAHTPRRSVPTAEAQSAPKLVRLDGRNCPDDLGAARGVFWGVLFGAAMWVVALR